MFISYSKNSKLFYSVRINELKDDMDDFSGRSQIWEKYEKDIQANILVGNGIVKSNEIIFDNLYIQYMYYYGIVGIIVLICLFVKTLLKYINCTFRKRFKTKEICIRILQFKLLL